MEIRLPTEGEWQWAAQAARSADVSLGRLAAGLCQHERSRLRAGDCGGHVPAGGGGCGALEWLATYLNGA